MNPGLKLDALIGKHVMGDEGYTVVIPCPDRDPYCQTTHTSTSYMPYSTDIFYAWQVVEKFKYRFLFFSDAFKEGLWECKLVDSDRSEDYVNGTTAPHAICLAALKAMGFEK